MPCVQGIVVPAPASSRPRRLRFGAFELDARAGELWNAGVRVPLQDQPLKLLERLLDRPGEVVTRDDLRGCLWPGDTFVDFEQGVNAAVKRLREALGDSAEAPRFVQTLPRRGYRFIASVETDDANGAPAGGADAHSNGDGDAGAHAQGITQALPQAQASATQGTANGDANGDSVRSAIAWRRAAAAIGIAGVLLTAAVWITLVRPYRTGASASSPESPSASLPPPRVVPLTRLDGSEHQPTFSPDGSQVAFTWDNGAPDNADIYVTLVGSAEVRRLTTDPGRDFAPQWSPDGRQIAYVRATGSTSQRVRVMSALGGSDREVSDFGVWSPIAWSPDGRFIAAGRAGDTGAIGQSHAIHLVPLGAGAPRALTRPGPGINDWSPAFAPDGRRLAYASCTDLVYRSMCHVKVVDLDDAYAPVGSPRTLTSELVWTLNGLAWTRDGKDVIYSARQGSSVQLWRADAAGTGARAPERIELAGPGVVYPATAPAGGRLAYTYAMEDVDIYRFTPPAPAQPLSRSSTQDSLPAFSPDGRRVAFCSARSADAFEIWVSNIDGSSPERLTHGPGDWQCSPSWSPDGTTIAFDSRAADGAWHVWTIGVTGGPPRRITMEQGNQVRPSWSRDGRWIYFVWRRDQDRDIWRIRASGGSPPERVTQGGAAVIAARESSDGKGVWFKRDHNDGALLLQPLTGGEPRPGMPCVRGTHFSIGSAGIYYVPCAAPGDVTRDVPVRLFNRATGEDRPFGTLSEAAWPAAGRSGTCLVISPDGRTLLYSRQHTREADLMLIEHFR